MNSAPASADSPAPPMLSWKIASTTMAFFTRLSFSAPQDCASTSGHRRRVFSNPIGETDMAVSLCSRQSAPAHGDDIIGTLQQSALQAAVKPGGGRLDDQPYQRHGHEFGL